MKYNFLLIALLVLIIPTITKAQTSLSATDQDALVKFIIVDPKGIPEEGAVVKIEAVDKKFSKQLVADIDGKCEMLIPEGQPFKVVVVKFDADFDFGVKNIGMKPGPQIITYKLSIELVTEYKRVYVLNKIYFEPNRYQVEELKPESMKQLNSLVDSLKKKPAMKIEIAGHTDNIGEDLINLHLSQKRADAIRGYLLSKGIADDRVLAKGYGETEPTASNDTPEGRSFNRRIEVKVIQE